VAGVDAVAARVMARQSIVVQQQIDAKALDWTFRRCAEAYIKAKTPAGAMPSTHPNGRIRWKLICIRPLATFENRTVTPAEKAQLNFYLDVMVKQPNGSPLDTLGRNQIASLLNWDAEKHRQAINLSPPPLTQ
jgi:hypothetical protein